MRRFIGLSVTLVGLMGFFTSAHADTQRSDKRALIAYMKVVPGTESQFLEEAEAVIEQSRQESGIVTYQLHQSVTEPQLFVFYELFASDAALQYHRNSPHVQAFLAATKAIMAEFRLEEYRPEGE
jgi:quinol monooxygenase YgiN